MIGDLAKAMLTYTTCPIVYKSFSKGDEVTLDIDPLHVFENNKGLYLSTSKPLAGTTSNAGSGRWARVLNYWSLKN